MYTKKMNIINKFIIGTILIGLGVFIIVTGIFTLEAMIFVFGFGFIGVGISTIVSIVVDKMSKKAKVKSLNIALINVVVGIIMLVYPSLPISLFALICGFYAILISLIRGVNYLISRRERVRGRLMDLFLSLFYLGFGIFLLLSPYVRVDIVLSIIGIFFILYGSMYYKDCIQETIPEKKKDSLKRRIRITMPAFFEMLIPRVVLDEVNKQLIPSDEKDVNEFPGFEQIKADIVPDIEIFIHASPKGFGMMGHVDICFDDLMISYGNYDAESSRFFELVGDGVLFTAQREEYIPFVIKDSNKTLFSFGIHLSDAQKVGVGRKIQELNENLKPWDPPKYIGKDDLYSARLNHQVASSFYKFKEGKFRTYFVCGTNCVLLVDQILGSAGIDVLKINGIITPGTYYEFLNREFSAKRMLVVSKNIYN